MTQLQRLVITHDQFSGQQIQLTAKQQHYLCRVLRLHVGDRFIAMDGKGWWLAVLSEDERQAEVLEPIAANTELSMFVNLLIALPKTGMDDIVRQTTELGVGRIVPIISQRTVLKPSPQKRDRWQRIAQEAAEQSERQLIPEVLPPCSWADALTRWNASQSTCYLCAARRAYPHLLTCLVEGVGSGEWERGKREEGMGSEEAQPPESENLLMHLPNLTIAIGPEGGWTDDEIHEAIGVGYQPVSLGPRILRAVTAPVMAMSLIASIEEVAWSA